jgi:hypothetical protein
MLSVGMLSATCYIFMLNIVILSAVVLVEVTDLVKRTSLQRYGINYDRKSFIVLYP